MKKIFFLTLVFANSIVVFSQKHCADKWLFGIHAGLDFSTGSPTVIPADSTYTTEGCSIMCDTLGNLLFYSDGVSVRDKTHALMPNGKNLMGNQSATQAALIVPRPGNPKLFYLFTLDSDAGINGCRVSIIDMNLRGGLGDLITRDSLLIKPATEKLTAVKDPFSNRYWVVVHGWNSSNFYAYEVNSAGIQAPIVSNVGIVHSGIPQNSFGQIKFNACGTKLGLADGYLNKVEIFDFNYSTGAVSNPITISYANHVYGFEFSADQDKIYVSTYNPFSTLLQYDISSGVQATIAASYVILSTTPDIYGLQMGNDGKIYVCKSYSQFLGVINTPNILGTGCNYVDNGIDLDPTFMGNTAALSLPGFVQSYFKDKQIACPSTTAIKEENEKLHLDVHPNPVAQTAKIEVPDAFFTGNLQLLITDISGKTVKEMKNISASIIILSVEELERGMYFFTVTNLEHKKMSGKFIVL